MAGERQGRIEDYALRGLMSQLDSVESHCHQLLDIEIYSAEAILRAEWCTDPDKNMSMAYMMAINRAKKIISICIKQYEDK